MRLNVSPNRMEVLRLRKRLLLARRGHKLLRDKQEELMRRFLELVVENKNLRDDVEERLRKGYQNLLFARAMMFADTIESLLSFTTRKADVTVSLTPLMNLRLPQLHLSQEGEVSCYGFAETSGELDAAISVFSETLPLMVKLSQIERWIELMAQEIETTRRRVNALEYILIPSLDETIRYITMKLSERERGDITRLMKVKEIVR
ncbi:V-type ATP synthase subunit D [candidate division NPL-UPA2 bacterium Unc8]|uniref:V-type ATP synthase subunit D n=1 Tax=candidate division NPL-UPA2 bacterium Unc8 TaxID=1980939 RepID=A0A399FUQ4_UNCN2|nr:V-type sodium ATPase subunit D [Bacillota bacterium]MBT9138866.1 V-type sodium ATPase subunit D [Bacillota bacterium]MBT9146772.1 V-type sodium ATPase subunit D [Bacillota bacterium]RIH99780.1 MAG: V-type ATP synthase subunit D [candidate division NPL-UPA2 bacterium Unc8]